MDCFYGGQHHRRAAMEYPDGCHHLLCLVLPDWLVSKRYSNGRSYRARRTDVPVLLGFSSLYINIFYHVRSWYRDGRDGRKCSSATLFIDIGLLRVIAHLLLNSNIQSEANSISASSPVHPPFPASGSSCTTFPRSPTWSKACS